MTKPRPGARPKKPPCTPEELNKARLMLEDGASMREITRTLGISKTTLRNKFPGMGWTYKESGEFRQLIRHAGAAA
ncbi:hypothetical protein [Arthrobacter bambusae]|uniref:hypothetical protein n=1 Tax=Arthrobacter bambusae TaxID=1338426 RepID=UPI0027851A78|nr:hypothetical protein [Arthrobacter bambusae]MDQ0241220.1 DNA invertase Pin-like site-specific DNA recombinase [Arthrobacter bambusae]